MLLLHIGTDPGVDGVLATHHKFYSFMIFHQNCFQIQSQECNVSKFSWWHAPRPDGYSKNIPIKCGTQALCKLAQHCQTPTINSAAIAIYVR